MEDEALHNPMYAFNQGLNLKNINIQSSGFLNQPSIGSLIDRPNRNYEKFGMQREFSAMSLMTKDTADNSIN